MSPDRMLGEKGTNNRFGLGTTTGCISRLIKPDASTFPYEEYSQQIPIGSNEIAPEVFEEPCGNSKDIVTLRWERRKKNWQTRLSTSRWYETLTSLQIMTCTSPLWREPADETTHPKKIEYFDPSLGWAKPDPPPGDPPE